MSTYKIIATVEKINFSDKELSICLKGVGKYLFEKDKEKKIYWNIFEYEDKPDEKILIDKSYIIPPHSIFVETDEMILINENYKTLSRSKFIKTDEKISIKQESLIPLSHAFSQKTKLKCEIEEKDSKYTLLSVSNDSEN